MPNKLRIAASPVQELKSEALKKRKLRLFVKRDDLLHPEVSGNKWRKLKYHVEAFYESKKEGVLTYGGAFSNHLAATAAACHALKIPCIGIVRGEYAKDDNPSLSRCKYFGMQLKMLPKSEYDAFARNTKEHPDFLKYFAIPEGGATKEGVRGCSEILSEIDEHLDFVYSPLGSGTTFAGLVSSLKSHQKGIAVAAIKAPELDAFFRDKLREFGIPDNGQWEVIPEQRFGGFAKIGEELIRFKKHFEKEHGFALDFIYTAKMFFELFRRIEEEAFPENSSILCLHTGGIQGNASIEERYKL